MKKIALMTVLTFTVFAACKKLGQYPKTNYQFDLQANCEESGIPEPIGFQPGYQFISDGPDYSSATFNPINPNEFLYYVGNPFAIPSYGEIIIYDRITKEKRTLTEMQHTPQISWGKNGWILLSRGVVSKIKTNGDSLQQICTGEAAEWNYSNNEFIYTAVDQNIKKYVGVIYDFHTRSRDTLPWLGLGSYFSWQNSKNLIVMYAKTIYFDGMVIIDMNKRSTSIVKKAMLTSCQPIWINDAEFIYSYDRNLLKFNISTFQETVLAEFCQNVIPSDWSYNAVSKEMITTISEFKYAGDNKIITKSKLMILNFNDNSVTYLTP